MPLPAVLPEALAVVGDDQQHDLLADLVQELTHELVRVAHLAVVVVEQQPLVHGVRDVAIPQHGARDPVPGEQRREVLGRLVGTVGLEQVHPEEARPRARLGPPGESPLEGPVAGAFGAGRLVIAVEASSEAGVPAQDEGAHEGPGRVAGLPQLLGERDQAGVPLVDRVTDPVRQHTVAQRVGPGEEAEVGGQGRRHGRPAGLEAHPRGGQGIEVGRGLPWVAVAAQVVRAQAVHRDHHEVRPLSAPAGRRSGRFFRGTVSAAGDEGSEEGQGVGEGPHALRGARASRRAARVREP